MIEREITPSLIDFDRYQFVIVTGPQQSGKTTLCRAAFADLEHINLEAPDVCEFARSDPRGFLARLGEGAILDKNQRAPELLSYLQVLADEVGHNRLFVLTDNDQSRLLTQSDNILRGTRRCSCRSLLSSGGGRERVLGDRRNPLHGLLSRIHDRGLDARQALGDYVEA